MIPDQIALYEMEDLLRWYNQWLQILRLQSLGGAIATAATNELPKPPFSLEEVERDLARRYEFGQID